MRVALVFPGQGSQYVGMGKALADGFPEAREALEEADHALGRRLTRLLFDGPEEELRLTWNTQPAILAVSVACLRALTAQTGLEPVAGAGHSLGEYTALVASGAMPYPDALRVVEARGRFMQEAVPVGVGSMAAVLGLEIGAVRALCAQAARPDRVVEVANDNSPGQAVISGHAGAVEDVARRAKEDGAKRVVSLPVSAPFHCSLMKPAGERLAPVLAAVPLAAPRYPVLANVDGEVHGGPEAIRSRLVRQVSSPVLWQACAGALGGFGAELVLEVGPGKVLTGLVRRILPEVRAANVEDPESLAAVRALLKGA